MAGAGLSDALSLPCGAVLPNRIAKAAMTEGLADRAGRPTAELTRLYERWGAGGAGLLLSGNVQIDAQHLERPGNVIVDSEPDAEMLAAMREWTAAATAGGRTFLGADQPCRAADAKGGQSASQGTIGGQAGLARRPIR